MQLTMVGETIWLVSCTQQKLLKGKPLPARELYMASAWFQKARAAAEFVADRWFVISAQYGLVAPDEEISRYNDYLGKHDADHGREWAEVIVDELRNREGEGARIVICASKVYVDALAPVLDEAGFEWVAPLAGLGIGDQKKYLGWAAGDP